MRSTQLPAEDDLEDILRDDPDRFMEAVYKHFARPVFRRIKWCGQGWLNPEDCWDVFQAAMLEISRKVREPDFDPKCPMRFVYRVVDCRARDERRRRTGLKVKTMLLPPDLPESKHAEGWTRLGQDERRNLQDTLLKCIATLPVRQRSAARAMVEHFEQIEAKGFQALADALAQATGENVTVTAARSRWYQARKKLQYELSKHGFGTGAR